MRSYLHRYAGLVILGIIAFSLAWIIPGSAQDLDEDKLQQGAQIFSENCAVCHGADGKGRVGATLAKDWPSIRPDLQVKTTVENGVAGSPMPPWSQANGGPLTEDEIDALVYYILSWQTGGPQLILPTVTAVQRPAITPPPGVSGDPNQGAILFDQNCVVCHGPQGEGRVGATLAKDWPSIRPDLLVKATIQRGVSGSTMPAWGQENGGPLLEEEINNLVAYILTWSTPPYPPTVSPTAAQPTQNQGINWGLWAGILVVVAILVAVLIYSSRKVQK
jgi:cytochrome c oxidase cbb3-type subunit 3